MVMFATTNHLIMYRKTLIFILVLLFVTHGVGQVGIDEQINEAFMPVAVWWENLIFTAVPIAGQNIPVVLILLIGGALFFTLRFAFINIRRFPLSIGIVRGKYDRLEEEDTAVYAETVATLDGDVLDTIKDEGHFGEVNHFSSPGHRGFRYRWAGEYCHGGCCYFGGRSRSYVLDDCSGSAGNVH